MRKIFKKSVVAAGLLACICIGCMGCGNNQGDEEHAKPQATSESREMEGDAVIEKEVEIDSDSGDKIEYSLEGPAGDEDQKDDGRAKDGSPQ